jgi:hypothetical protein
MPPRRRRAIGPPTPPMITMDVRIKVNPAVFHRWKVGYCLHGAVSDELRHIPGVDLVGLRIRNPSAKIIAKSIGIEPYNAGDNLLRT